MEFEHTVYRLAQELNPAPLIGRSYAVRTVNPSRDLGHRGRSSIVISLMQNNCWVCWKKKIENLSVNIWWSYRQEQNVLIFFTLGSSQDHIFDDDAF